MDEAALVRDLLDAFPADGGGDQHGCLVDDEERQVVGVAYYQPKGPADRLWDLRMIKQACTEAVYSIVRWSTARTPA